MKLVKFEDNWADEMEIFGWNIMESSTWNIIENLLKDKKERFEVYFGTNEFNEYPNGEDFLRNYTVVEITDQEVEFLNRVFGGYKERGEFPSPWENWEYDDNGNLL